jgi:hypothetical protein
MATASSPTTPGVGTATLGLAAFPLASGIAPSWSDTAPSGRQCRVSAWQCGQAAAHPCITFQAEIQSGFFGVLLLEHCFGGVCVSGLRVGDVLRKTIGYHSVSRPGGVHWVASPQSGKFPCVFDGHLRAPLPNAKYQKADRASTLCIKPLGAQKQKL